MQRYKCSQCDLVNLTSDEVCRRCGNRVTIKPRDHYLSRSPREAAKRSSWFYTVVFLLVVAAPLAYFYSGIQRSVNEIQADEIKRLATQPKQPAAGLSRTEYEQKQAGQYKTAIQNSNGLSESQKHTKDVEKLMQPATDQKR
jgi:DNA-directed RNA polymerase subunit RPC12/RpoP